MSSAIIEATTAAIASNPFAVSRGESVGIKAYGLTGSDTVTIQVLVSSVNQWQDVLGPSGILTATAYQTTINASGTYRAVKTATAALAGVDID